MKDVIPDACTIVSYETVACIYTLYNVQLYV